MEWLQIAKNQAGKACPYVVFRYISPPDADLLRPTSGEKKCFFSRTENQSLEIETRLDLKRLKKTSLKREKLYLRMPRKHLKLRCKKVFPLACMTFLLSF